MAADPLQIQEDQLLNKVRMLYGIDPNGVRKSTQQERIADIERRIAALGADPSLTTTPSRDISGGRNRINRGERNRQQTIAQYQRDMRDLQIEKDSILKGIGGEVQVDQGMFDEANKNRMSIDKIFTSARRGAVDEGTRQLDDRFTGSLRLHRARASGSGQAGGSADVSSRRRMLADLFRGRQAIKKSANEAETLGRNSLDDRRMELERQVKTGTAPDINMIHSLDQASADVNQAYKDLPQLALGSLFAGGGDVYRDTTQAGAYGRRGGSAFYVTPRNTGSRSGSITG